MANKLFKKYPYIYGWGRMMGSKDWFIQDQMELANKENAPSDATHRRRDGTWSVLSNIASEITKDLVLKFARGG